MTVTEDPGRSAHDRAVEAFRLRRRGVLVLDVLHDTLLDGPLPDRADDDADRVLLFGRDDLRLGVAVRYSATEQEATELMVEQVPEGAAVELLTDQASPRVVKRGRGPLLLLDFAKVPASLLLTLADGRLAQTAWLVF